MDCGSEGKQPPRSKNAEETGQEENGAYGLSAEAGKKLQVEDALSYLELVKKTFSGNSDVYDNFLEIMKEFKTQLIDTKGVIERVSGLFREHSQLINGFNTFLPPGYRITAESNGVEIVEPTGEKWVIPSRFDSKLPPGISEIVGSRIEPKLPQGLLEGVATRTFNKLSNSSPSNVLNTERYLSSRVSQQNIGHFSEIMGNNYSEMVGNSLSDLMGNNYLLPQRQIFPAMNGKEVRIYNAPIKPMKMTNAIQFMIKVRDRYGTTAPTYSKFLGLFNSYHERIINYPGSVNFNDLLIESAQLFGNAKDLLAEFSDFIPDCDQTLREQLLSNIHTISIAHSNAPSSEAVANHAGAEEDEEQEVEGDDNKDDSEVEDEEVEDDSVVEEDEERTETSVPLREIQEFFLSASKDYSAEDAFTRMCTAPLSHVVLYYEVARAYRKSDKVAEVLKNLDILQSYGRIYIEPKDLDDYLKHVFHEHPYFVKIYKDIMSDVTKLERSSMKAHDPNRRNFVQTLPLVGKSYRRLPADYKHSPCSGRDEHDNKFLNDELIGFPLWQTDEKRGEGIVHKKSPTEELYIKLEDERFEVDSTICLCNSAYQVLEVCWDKIKALSPAKRLTFKTDEKFGGTSGSLIFRALKKLYGIHTRKLIDSMLEFPHPLIEVASNRLKIYIKEMMEHKVTYNSLWRKQSDKLFYKTQDYQAQQQKVHDLKILKGKYLLAAITDRTKRANKINEHDDVVFERNEHLENITASEEVIKDVSMLLISFVKRQVIYNSKEKLLLAKMINEFVPKLLGIAPDYINEKLFIEECEEDLPESEDGSTKANTEVMTDEISRMSVISDSQRPVPKIGTATYNSLNECSSRKRLFSSPSADEPASKYSKASDTIERISASSTKEQSREQSSDHSNEQSKEQSASQQESIPSESTNSQTYSPPDNTLPIQHFEYRTFYGNDSFVLFIRSMTAIIERLAMLKRKHLQMKEHYKIERSELDKRTLIAEIDRTSLLAQHMNCQDPLEYLDALRPKLVDPEKHYETLMEMSKLFVQGKMEAADYEEQIRKLFTTSAHLLYSLDKFVQFGTKHLLNSLVENDGMSIISLYNKYEVAKEVALPLGAEVPYHENTEYQTAVEDFIQKSKIYRCNFVKDTDNVGWSITVEVIKLALADDSGEEEEENVVEAE
uniref:HDAC_interact domain-containing protein n=1 Tax=Rhabditophanes sp. KR3021 TaxID=114890 RepID=A0AC35TLB8_9BILA